MTTLGELYSKVRTQTDTVQSELPDALINTYLNEAFNRTIAAENLWPFYENVWSLTLPAGESTIAIPGNVNEPGIVALWDDENQFRLRMLDLEKSLDYFDSSTVPPANGAPSVYSLWANEIALYPSVALAADKEYRLIGYRRPVAWETLGVSDAPDCDQRLHLPLAHYATALAYAREEDESLERTYMERWQKDVEMARQAIMEANRQRPLVMGPHFRTPIGNGIDSMRLTRVTINTP